MIPVENSAFCDDSYLSKEEEKKEECDSDEWMIG
jgi:hypothetical protein